MIITTAEDMTETSSAQAAKEWFEFYIDHYRDQFARSDLRLTREEAMTVCMPDYGRGETRSARLHSGNDLAEANSGLAERTAPSGDR